MKRQEPQTIFQLQRDPPFYHDLPHSGLDDSGDGARVREPYLNADLQWARVLCSGKKEPLKTELEPLTQRGRLGKTGEMTRPREAIRSTRHCLRRERQSSSGWPFLLMARPLPHDLTALFATSASPVLSLPQPRAPSEPVTGHP